MQITKHKIKFVQNITRHSATKLFILPMKISHVDYGTLLPEVYMVVVFLV